MNKLILLLSALFIIACGCSTVSNDTKSALVSYNTSVPTEKESATTAKEIHTICPAHTPCKSEATSGANDGQRQTSKPDNTPTGTPTYEVIPAITPDITPDKTHEHTQTPVKTPNMSIVPTKPQETPTKTPETPTIPPETPTKLPETSTKPQETPTTPPETSAKPQETPTKLPETPTKPPENPTKPQETPTKAPEFDINYWVAFAKNYAVSIGFKLDSNAVYSWDNPIRANAKSKNLERDIRDRLDWYLFSNTIQYIWVWAEETAPGEYNLFISYA